MGVSAGRLLRWLPARTSLPALFRPLGLQARITLLVASGLLALFALFVFLGLSALRDSTARDFQGRAVLAQTGADHLDFVLNQVAGMAGPTVAELAPPLESGDLQAASRVVQSSYPRLASLTQGLLLFDSSGERLHSEPNSAGLSYPRLAPSVQAALRAGKPSAVDWVGITNGGAALVVVPVASPSAKTLGYLGALVDLVGPAMGDWLHSMTLGNSGEVEVVNSEGVVLVSTGQADVLPSTGHEGYFSGLMAEAKPTVTTCYNCHASPGGARRLDIMAFAPLKAANWGVVLRQAQDEVLEPTRRLQQQVLGLGAASLLVALVVVGITTRRVLNPVRNLTLSARRIAEGNLEDAVSVQGNDEIAELGRMLENMRVRLGQSIEKIKDCSSDLDRRVQERTAELEQSRYELASTRDRLQTLVDRLSTLNAIAVALNQSLDLETILDGALQNALRLTGMEAGAIYLVDEHTGELELAARRGLSREAAQVAANLGLSASLCASVAQSGELLVVEDTGKYARGSRAMLRSENMRCMVRVPFKSSGGLLGTMCLGSRTARTLSSTEKELLLSVSNQIAVAVQNARLYEELQRKEQMRGELLQKVIGAQEEERKRIARELHDQTSQALAALGVAVETAAAQAAEGDDVSASLGRMRALAMSTLEEVHRLIFDLRPTLLDDLGLIAALRWYTETRLGEVGMKVRLEVAGEERRLAPQLETALYRVVQEAVNNVANHSGAQSFTVTLVLKAESLSLTMMDDGWGFDMAELARSTDRKRGLGLMGMKERVELLGGTFAIYSELGGGTKITLEVPLQEGESEGDG